jgi:hypothetical protein
LNLLTVLKRLAAISLMLAFFLPLSQCSTKETNFSEKTISQLVQTAKSTSSDGIVYAYRADKDGALFTLLNGFAFIWPLLFSLLAFVRPAVEQNLSVRLSELVLCVGSALILLRLTMLGELLSGGYLAWCALAIYVTITLVSFIARVRLTWQVPA